MLLCGITAAAAPRVPADALHIPTVGNIFVTSDESGRPGYREDGSSAIDITGRICNWSDQSTVLSVYFKTSASGKLDLWLHGTAGEEKGAKSTILVTVGGKQRKVTLKGGDAADYSCGSFDVKAPGYVKIDLQGLQKSGETFGLISNVVAAGAATKGETHFTSAEHADNAYWSRRGPSVHMNYSLPAGDIEYFYNEVTVPEGSDVNGTYYMLTGFGEGYMGIQAIRGHNGRNANRVLFSVWSPYSTDNPNEIPDSLHVEVLAKGQGVTAKNFGNEGSGKQSFMDWPWQTGKTYKTLVRVRPDGKGNTVYTGYFCDENGEWHLLSSLQRPVTDTWYRHAHSFLECFNTSQSFMPRSVEFRNQWVCDRNGQWHEITDASFSCDNTGRSGVRVDYNGGVKGDAFYLQNCGFVSDTTPYGTRLHRSGKSTRPEIDLKALEAMTR